MRAYVHQAPIDGRSTIGFKADPITISIIGNIVEAFETVVVSIVRCSCI